MKRLLNIIFSIAKGITAPILNFLILSYGILTFGKENWGEYISIVIWISLLAFVLNLGNKDYLIRKYSKEPSNVINHFINSFISRSLLIVISTLLFFFFNSEIAIVAILTVFVLHTYNSFESLVVYYQKFGQQFFVEIIGFLIFIVLLKFQNNFDLIMILKFYGLSIAVKSLLMFILFKPWDNKIKLNISFINLMNYWPFFVLGLSGMINSKIDLFLVNILLSKKDISIYQTVTTAFLILQSLSILITAPINKPIYRASSKTISRIKLIFSKIAIPITLIGSICIWVVLEQFLKLGLNWHFYLISFLASIPCFYYIVPVLSLFKSNNEKKVLYSNLSAAIINCLLSLILLKLIGLEGAFISACISQWLFYFFIKKYENITSRQ